MQLGPDLGTGAEHQQTNRFAALTRRHHEQPHSPFIFEHHVPRPNALCGRRYKEAANSCRLISTLAGRTPWQDACCHPIHFHSSMGHDDEPG
jgi:hypothetical protein